MQWRIQRWSQGGITKGTNVSGWRRSVSVTLSPPMIKTKSMPRGGVSGQPENPPGYCMRIHNIQQSGRCVKSMNAKNTKKITDS